MKKLVVAFLLFFWLNCLVYSQNTDLYGMADKSIPELSQFEYYRGLWSVQMEIKQKDGSFKKMEGESTIRGMFLKDHKTFQSQYSTKKGAFTTDIRTYNTEKKNGKLFF